MVRLLPFCILLLPLSGGCTTPPGTTGDPEEILTRQMREHWAHPERRTWRIDHRPVDGLGKETSWYVEGTMFWVRIHPDIYRLEELDPDRVYEIDAVALAQHYGVIDFYLYGYPRVVEPASEAGVLDTLADPGEHGP